MIWLPIVERELRVAARRPATYWLRLILGTAVFALWFLIYMFGPVGLLTSRGQMVFSTLSAIAFGFALLSGPLLTADSLSQERREGTLGLLFLTELQGYDVVLGKLIATSIHAFYGMAAIVPLLFYSMLAGGVTGWESLRLGIVLLATVFFSLSAGMLVSAHVREARQAMGGTLSIVIVLACVLAGLGMILASLSNSGMARFPSWPSPIYLFAYAFDNAFQTRGGPAQFGASLFSVLTASVVMLILAGRHLTRAWHEKDEFQRFLSPEASQSRSPILAPASLAPRGESLSADPYLWLASRDLRQKQKLRGILGGFFVLWGCLIVGSFTSVTSLQWLCFWGAVLLAFLLHHGLKWLIAFESPRRLSEDRQSGALELLLVTPVSIEEIISGQRRALVNLFRAPICCAILANAILLFVTVLRKPVFLSPWEVVLIVQICLGGTILMLVDFRALTWVGMWMALTSRRHTRAIQATLLRVMLAPWLAIFVLVLLTIGGGGLSSGMGLGMCLFWFGLGAIMAHAFASRAKVGLLEAFRQFSVAPDSTHPDAALSGQPLAAPAIANA